MDKRELAYLYGPATSYSDHKRGERVTFLFEEQTRIGVIVWVCTAHEVEEKGIMFPVIYVVEVDPQGNFPCIVWPGEIIERR